MQSSFAGSITLFFCSRSGGSGLDAPQPFRHLEVVGLNYADPNPPALADEIAGSSVVKVGDLLRLKKTQVLAGCGFEDAVACVLVRDAEEVCRVAYVPQILVGNPMIERNIDRFAQVVELYETSANSAKQEKSKRDGGVAAVVLLDEIPNLE
mmetsp:Transcript_19164/g.52629  ORF Transcript_19164/g.52629 Transcript_19164/m.52629 type:complete len:152 (-) Transcript_19164:59-514(-)